MKNLTQITPIKNESPTLFADRVGKIYNNSGQRKNRKEIGQFLTPVPIAEFMARLVDKPCNSVKILDPGAGTGILSIALCEYLIKQHNNIEEIKITAYEIDKELSIPTKECIEYLKKWVSDRNISLSYEVKTEDFVIQNGGVIENELTLFPNYVESPMSFDIVISNPPYFKLSKSDPRTRAAFSIVHGQPNIYALFMMIAASLLKPNGQLVFITPRSYTSGYYFELFRKRFFSLVKPETIHLFKSRKKPFYKDSVLQENIILKARRFDEKDNKLLKSSVSVSYSEDTEDLKCACKREISLEEIIDYKANHNVLIIPISTEEDKIIKYVNTWKENLSSHNMEVSTGPVVPFRAINFLIECGNIKDLYAPFLWMQNVKPMVIDWPLENSKKSQYIKVCNSSDSLLVNNQNYVLLRRFTAKEEKRRLIAAPFFKRQIESDLLGLENHLNYIHRPGGELAIEEILGLSVLLNSSVLDNYFRTFNGNTQVSATELRNIPMPSLNVIKEIGTIYIKQEIDIEQLDNFICKILNI